MVALANLLLTPAATALGDYCQGNAHGSGFTTLSLRPHGRFQSTYTGCFDRFTIDGTYIWEGGRVILQGKAQKAFPSAFILVPWGGRRFLVTSRSMPDFCAKVRSGWRGEDANRDRKFFRDGLPRLDPNAHLTGQPRIPAPWSRLLKRR